MTDGRSDRLWLGHKPVEIADGALSAAEAHAWLLDGEPCVTTWLLANAGLTFRVRQAAVARWLIAVEQSPQRREALHRVRRVRAPNGEEIEVVYATRVDEVSEEDLTEGVKTSVQRAIERAAERLGRALNEQWSEDHRALRAAPSWWKPVRCARLLLTPAALVAEGDEMSHCVGNYVPLVERGEAVIIAINVRGERSTLEISPNGRIVRQHRGPFNRPPPELCLRAWRVVARRCGVAEA